jgi:alpha-tubulin suppressor-like RCC1 family protein
MSTYLTHSLSWGQGTRGQLGTGSSSGQYNTPQQVTGLTSGVDSVSCGSYHTCVLMTDTTARCWVSLYLVDDIWCLVRESLF